jgi:hypothetical protein
VVVEIENPVIIIGCRRSGTTLLRAILNEHPDLLVHPDEPQFIVGTWKRFRNPIKYPQIAVRYIQNHEYCINDITADEIMSYYDSREMISFKDLIKAYLYAWIKDKPDNAFIVLKDPAFSFYLELIDSLFSNPRYIHIYRDPRANIASQKSRWRNTPFLENIRWWLSAVHRCREWGRAHQRNFLEVTFENLVLEPEITIKKVCQFIDIPYVETMLSFRLIQRIFTPNEEPINVIHEGVDRTRLDTWRSHLNVEEIRFIKMTTSKLAGDIDWPLSKSITTNFSYGIWVLRNSKEFFIYRLIYLIKSAIRNLLWWYKYQR